jgi:hypothetical protein
MIATRLGETPFMALIPCASFALRIKVRTLFGIKVSTCIVDCYFKKKPLPYGETQFYSDYPGLKTQG